jgi:predicted nucleic acid-binding protein
MQSAIGEDEEIFVPVLLWYEMANIFSNLIRRKRYNSDEVLQFFPLLFAIRLKNDFESGTVYTQKLFSPCNDYNISSYDAAYLELAHRKKAILCTLNEKLQAAAEKHDVPVSCRSGSGKLRGK